MTFRVHYKTGTLTQNLTYTGLQGEITVNTDTFAIRVHDGYTPGGHELARQDLSNVDNATFYAKAIAAGLSAGGGGTPAGGGGIYDGGDPFTDFTGQPTLNAGGVF